jgi:hypothetical protein
LGDRITALETSSRSRRRPLAGWRRWPAIGVVTTLLVGLFHLPFPYHGDQALFAVYARMMAHGAVLYRDMWDVKQPGIFMTYRFVGLVGFSEVAIHAFELILLLAVVVVGMAVLRPRFSHALALGALPVLSIGFVYLGARTSELAQLETFTIPFVAIAVWALFCTETRPQLMWFVAGLAAALVGLFKSLLVIVPVALIVYAVYSRPNRRQGGSLRLLAAAFAGFVLPGLAFTAWTVGHGLESRIWYTFVTYPLHASAGGGLRDVGRLVKSTGAFVLRFAPLLVLAAVRVRRLFRGERDRFSVAMLVWLAAGAVTVLLQLWWSYLFLVLVPPLAILAAEGLDDLLTSHSLSRRSAVALAVLSLPALAVFAVKVPPLVSNGFAIGAANAEQYRAAVSEPYAAALEETASVSVTSDIYVLGDPLILYVSGADQAVPPQAWSIEAWDDQTRSWVADSLTTNPPEQIFVSTEASSQIEGTAVAGAIQLGYRQIRSSDNGSWYERRSR